MTPRWGRTEMHWFVGFGLAGALLLGSAAPAAACVGCAEKAGPVADGITLEKPEGWGERDNDLSQKSPHGRSERPMREIGRGVTP